MFKTSFITLFPDAFPGPLGVSILERARREGIWDYETVDLRPFGLGKHRNVDETPAGGGAGMVLRPDVAAAAIDSLDRTGRPLIYLSPRGKPFDQAMALTEAVVRLLPGVAGNEASLEEESFETGLLEHPHYTLPREWEGRPTPEVLLSGDHKRIEEWRLNSAKALTIERRPDLYAAYSRSNEFKPPESGDEHD